MNRSQWLALSIAMMAAIPAHADQTTPFYTVHPADDPDAGLCVGMGPHGYQAVRCPPKCPEGTVGITIIENDTQKAP